MAAVRVINPYNWRPLGWAAAHLVPAAFCVALCASLFGLIAHITYAYVRRGDSAVLVGGKGEFYLAALPAWPTCAPRPASTGSPPKWKARR